MYTNLYNAPVYGGEAYQPTYGQGFYTTAPTVVAQPAPQAPIQQRRTYQNGKVVTTQPTYPQAYGFSPPGPSFAPTQPAYSPTVAYPTAPTVSYPSFAPTVGGYPQQPYTAYRNGGYSVPTISPQVGVDTGARVQGQGRNWDGCFIDENTGGQVPASAPFTAPGGGRKRALLIGITYKGQLPGTVKDINALKSFVSSQGFKDITVLSDAKGLRPNAAPTRQNIINALQALSRDARPGDSLFFGYSGHGSQTADMSGDERDNLDETIVPIDYLQRGQIIDDDLYFLLVHPLPAGVRLTCVMDCCHSGTGLDLPYSVTVPTRRLIATAEQKLRERGLIGSLLGSIGGSLLGGDVGGFGLSIVGAIFGGLLGGAFEDLLRGRRRCRELKMNNRSRSRTVAQFPSVPKFPQADVVVFSASRDYETAVEVGSGGVLSSAFLQAVQQASQDPSVTYADIAFFIAEKFDQWGVTQAPVLQASKPFQLRTPFRI